MLRVLDLFSGIGGFSLGLEATGGFETVAFCEQDMYCQRVLAKHWPGVPCHSDIKELTGDAIGPVDVVCGGYPCQPFSVAGQRAGAEDDRHLWPEMYRLVDEIRPAWVIGENVAGHISMGIDDVLSDLEGIGYAWRPFVIPACAVDAHHRRDRVWIVAHAASDLRRTPRHERPKPLDWGSATLADAENMHGDGGEFHGEHTEREISEPRNDSGADAVADAGGSGLSITARGEWTTWLAEPGVGRVAHGVSNRVDRLRALGNAVVPQVVEMIGWAILAAEEK